MFNIAVPSYGNKDPPLEEVSNDDQAQATPPSLWDRDIRATFIKISQAITTEAQIIITQDQLMTTQDNREVVPLGNQHVSSMASLLRDLTSMNLPTLYGSKVKVDTQEFIDEFYKILYVMGLTTSEKAELSTYQLKDVARTWYV